MSASYLIPFEKVKEYVDANIPIVPLKVNGDPHVYFLYDTKNGEEEKLANNLSEYIKKHVYSGGHVQVLKLLNQQIPRTFWTDERIRNQQWYGIGCKTGLTAIPAKSDPNKVLLIIAIEEKISEEKKKGKKLLNTDEVSKFKGELSAINLKIENLFESAFKMIDLENQVILALDTPQDGFLEVTHGIGST